MGGSSLDQLLPAARAVAQVPHDRPQLVAAELAAEQEGQLLVDVTVALVVSGHSSPPSFTTISARRCMPLAIRAFTVPRGTPSRPAISTWVCPPK